MMLTSTPALPSVLKLLADELRWQLIQALALSDRKVQELTEIVGRPMNLVSYHLRHLRNGNLVRVHRSGADSRDLYYRLDLEALHTLYYESGAAIHPSLEQVPAAALTSQEAETTLPPTRVLFLCTHNSARSQMAEALLQLLGQGRVEAQSAGTEATRVHPLAIQTMEERGIDIRHARSKHLNEFIEEQWDYVITTCDSARESCPVFPGDPVQIHWSFEDPSAVKGSDDEKLQAFRRTAQELNVRLNHLLLIIDRDRRSQ